MNSEISVTIPIIELFMYLTPYILLPQLNYCSTLYLNSTYSAAPNFNLNSIHSTAANYT